MSRSLAARLRGHVPGELDAVELAWWTAPGAGPAALSPRALWRSGARRRRTAELAQIVDHLAALVALGCGPPVALERTVERGHGTVVDELATVTAMVRDGMPAARALRRAAGRTGCDGLGRLAAALTAPADELAGRLDGLAVDLRARAHDDRMAVLHAAAHMAWIMALVAGAGVAAA